MEKIFLKLGKRDGLKVGDIVGAIAGEAGIEGDLIGKIDMLDSFSFVDVDSTVVDKVISSLNGQRIKGKEVIVDKARENTTGGRGKPEGGRPERKEWKKYDRHDRYGK